MKVFRPITLVLICTAFIFLQTACTPKKSIVQKPSIIPIPNHQELGDGVFKWDDDVFIAFENSLAPAANLLKLLTEKSLGKISANGTKKIELKLNPNLVNPEAYTLQVTPQNITITAKSLQGAFYGVQTLRQLLPPCIENATCNTEVAIPAITIEDAPYFKYRGMHLDVGRHFFPVAFIKKYIDMLAMLKMNTFHWHLTEDQGWRIEIKKYPKLTTHAAYRKETLIGHYSNQPHKFDGKKYGGFYTQEEIKDVVAYAASRGITIIPEIELPGHSQAAISAYPELGCTGKPIDVATKWGIFEDIYCPKESTFTFLENVFDEVLQLFPSNYIHIGGDEAPKTRWESCENCQKRIKQEGLKDEHELQSYFITRIEKYLNSKGRKIIGWDEILEGGLAPNATVMSWRGTAGAIEAAKQGHDVILTPGSHCYFDHYQSDDETEPLAIGGLTTLEKVYHFNPIPKELTPEQSKYVLGAQGNVWTEYMKTPDKVEYMVFPRILALSEVVWSYNKNKNYNDFLQRVLAFNKRLDALSVNYANHLYNINDTIQVQDSIVKVSLSTKINKGYITYTTNGTLPTENSTKYTKPIKINNTTTLKARAFNKQKPLGQLYSKKIVIHKALGADVLLSVLPHDKYADGGPQAITNGIFGSKKRFADSEWLGFNGQDVEVVLNMHKTKNINNIIMQFYNEPGSWIHAPKNIYFLFSEDGVKYSGIKKVNVPRSANKIVSVSTQFPNIKAKYIKIMVENFGEIPENFSGAGNLAWTFLDEIQVW